MQTLVVFFMIGLLKKDVRPYAGFLQAGIAFYGRSCNIDIDTADGTVLMMYAVYRE